MPYSVLVNPDKDPTRREFVETVDDVTMANDLVKHIQDHSPPSDYVFQQWGNRPTDATRDYDRSRWQEKPVERDVDGKPLPT